VTFEEAAEEWLRYVEYDPAKPSTIVGYRAVLRSQLLPRYGELSIESITTPMIEEWIAGVDRSPATRTKALVLMHGIFKRAIKLHGLPLNPVGEVERPPVRRSGDIEVFSVEGVMALVGAAASEQDAALYLTAAFTGLRRQELLALRWRDADFAGEVIRVRASYADGALTTPKSGKARSVPMAPDVATALAKLAHRERWTGDDDLVFVSQAGGFLDGRALRRRCDKALRRTGLRKLRFHDPRHTFGTRMIAKADIRRVQEWMGHSGIETTQVPPTTSLARTMPRWSPRVSECGASVSAGG
jgi:integrase